MLIALVSAKGSPGVTTAALALAAAWPRQACVLDADPCGGDVRVGIGGGAWPAGRGLTELVVQSRAGLTEELLADHLHRPADHSPPVMAGLGCIGQASGVPWDRIGPFLARLQGGDVVADCGRYLFADGVVPLLAAADLVVLVAGSSLRSARAASRTAPLLRGGAGADPVVVVSRPGAPYSAREISDSCELTLAGVLGDDPRSAAVWSDGVPPARGFSRAALQRDARRVAEALATTAASVRGAA